MKKAAKALAIFLRHPEAGKVKTRLAASVGDLEAAHIYERLARRTLGVATDFKRRAPGPRIFVFFTPADRQEAVQKAFPGPWQFVPQQGEHLGERMHRAMQQTLAGGCRQVVLVGTDLADLEEADLHDAFASLDEGDAVLNPAADGGFYLIGVDRPCPAALAPEQWGTPHVFQRTRELLLQAGFRVRCGRLGTDVDRPEDLDRLRGQPLLEDRLSIVIPTRQPAAQLLPLLDRLGAQLWPGDEIIVSLAGDACSVDHVSRLNPWPRLVHSPAGRGVQLNRGAEHAAGNLLWFLHDDSRPPDQFGYFIRKISAASHCSLGCFLLGYQPSNRSMDWIARWANFRTRRLGLPYGDQGLFCRSEVFPKLGGYQKRYLMEDVDFVRRARQLGKLLIIDERLCTSPTRYLARGILRASLQNHLTMLLYLLGVDEAKLASFYYR